jgi:hypothetical protein
MKRENWIWMPHAGHFILGDRCRFHLTTKVGKYIVSTVGELWNDSQVRRIHAGVAKPKWYEQNKDLKGDNFDHAYFKEFGYEEIGHARKYETMVFKSMKPNKERKCDACPYIIKNGNNLDYEPYNDPKEAYKGHMKMCKKWSKK